MRHFFSKTSFLNRGACRSFRGTRKMGSHDQKVPGNIPVELAMGLTAGIGVGLVVRNYLQNEISSWQDAATPTKLVAPKKVDMASFNSWLDKQKAASPADDKDTEDYKFIEFTQRPPFTAAHKSPLATILTSDIWQKYKDLKTSNGFSFSNIIQTGVTNPDAEVGVVAGDEDCFEVFGDFFDAVFQRVHGAAAATAVQPTDIDPLKLAFSREQQLKFDLYVKSTRVSAPRNLAGFAFPAAAGPDDRRAVEEVLQRAFVDLNGELRGSSVSLESLSESDQASLDRAGLAPPRPSLAAAARGWPEARGLFASDSRTAAAWYNGDDHVRLVSAQNGGDLWTTFARFSRMAAALDQAAQASGTRVLFNDRLGYLASCPSQMGTGLEAGVVVRLPLLTRDPRAVEKACETLGLTARAKAGGVWDVTNRSRLGTSEVGQVQAVVDGVSRLIAAEEALAANPSLNPLQALATSK